MFGRHAFDSRRFVDQFFINHLDGDAHRRRATAFAGTRLQHPELAALDRKLAVLHVAVVLFEQVCDRRKLFVNFRQLFLELGDRIWRTSAGDHVFALRVQQVLTVNSFLPVDGLRVKATPVPLPAPMFPKTIAWTLTAVPKVSGMRLMRR